MPLHRVMILSITCISLLFELALTAVGSGDQGVSFHEGRRTVALRTMVRDNLQMSEGAPFKIALFADLHFGEDAWTEWGPEQDVKSVKVMSAVLDKEQPDFVVYLGDVITANNIPIENASLYWDQAISPTRNKNIPWASVFGNHDDAAFEWPLDWFSAPGIPPLLCAPKNSSCSRGEQCSFKGTTRLKLMRRELDRNSLSYSRSGPKNLWPSVSNYVLQLSSSNDPKLPVAFMYFFDSGGGSYPEVISSAQAEWFRQKSQEINPDSRVPEIILWHIPSKAYEKVGHKSFLRKKKKKKKKKNKCVGSLFMEDVAPQEAEFGIMKLLEQRSSVKAIFVGHNHGLDWCCPNKKMWLCFARHSGYGGYGNWPRGSRILEITQDPFTLKSWIRMEDGHSHSEVILSS